MSAIENGMDVEATAFRAPRVLAISSPGGHWMQLTSICRSLAPDVVYARADRASDGRFLTGRGTAADAYLLPDANKDQPVQVVRCLEQVVRLLRRSRPDLVVSTGAAPGCLACVFAALTGRRAVFIDSIANAERLSLSARICAALGVEVVTQWPNLDGRRGVTYRGSVLGELQ